MRPAGGKQQAGYHSESGIHLANQLHSGFCTSSGIIGTDNVSLSNHRRIDLFSGNLDRIGRFFDNSDYKATVIIKFNCIILTSS